MSVRQIVFINSFPRIYLILRVRGIVHLGGEEERLGRCLPFGSVGISFCRHRVTESRRKPRTCKKPEGVGLPSSWVALCLRDSVVKKLNSATAYLLVLS
jgi:hypothetical protein